MSQKAVEIMAAFILRCLLPAQRWPEPVIWHTVPHLWPCCVALLQWPDNHWAFVMCFTNPASVEPYDKLHVGVEQTVRSIPHPIQSHSLSAGPGARERDLRTGRGRCYSNGDGRQCFRASLEGIGPEDNIRFLIPGEIRTLFAWLWVGCGLDN